jgi:dihydroxyacetone kinase-like protein
MTNQTIDLDQLTGWLTRFRDLVTEQVTHLTELDSAVGDADHGSNMTRGMGAVVEAIQASPAGTVDELFKSVGMTLVKSVGGASGPLFGTFFLRFGATAGPVDALDAPGLASALRAGMGGVVARGKAEVGDKTMLDALTPAVDAFEAAVAAAPDIPSAASAAYSAAQAGRDTTEAMSARKGRASYLGERSIGHIDPGAASTALLFQALDETLAQA